MTILNQIASNWSRVEREKLNDNWTIIEIYLSNLQGQINYLTGEIDIKALIDQLNEIFNQGNTIIADLEAALNDATTVIDDAQNATTDANNAAQNALAAINDIQNMLDNFQTKGTYDNETVYYKNNSVLHEGSSYIYTNDTPNKGNPPPNYPIVSNGYWHMTAAKGTSGSGAVSKVNGKEPNGEGEITLTPNDIGAASSTDLTSLEEAVTTHLEDVVQKVTVDDLPMSGIVSAHRGGGATGYPYSPVAADGGFSGYDMAIRLGAHIIDVDYRTTADGVMIAMHDTTVDRTTNGAGLVSDHLSSALPNIETSRYCGMGWADEPIPTIEEILIRYGGRVIITIEAKEGVPSVEPLASLIKKYKLIDSVFINTHLPAVATEIVAQGCIAHVWGCDTVQKVNDAATASAWLIEVPHNASTEIVNAALNSSIKRIIAGPVWFRSQVDGMTNGIMGHVTDAIGMTNRKTGDAPLVKSIVPSLKANKVGVGWRTRGIWKVENQKIVNHGRGDLTTSEHQCVYFGDLSGAREATYTILFKVVLPQTMIGKASGMRLRVCCLIADGNGWDADTDGYVCNIRGNGQMNLWKSNGSFGSGILLGQTTTDQPVSAGVEYTVMINVTPTTITMTREDTGQNIVAVDSTYRGDHIYLWSAGGDTELVGAAVTDITITA